MTAKKKAAKKKTTRKKTSSSKAALVPVTPGSPMALPGSWQDELGSYVSRDSASATGGSGWPFLSTKGGKFSDGAVTLDEITVVILGAARVNAYFSEDYDPDVAAAPACFAIDKDQNESTMAPPDTLKAKQSDQCEGCWANAFGSAARGNGKACKNGVRLCVLPYDLDGGNNFEKVEGAMINTSPTALKAWTAYATRVTTGLRRPLFSMVTRIRLVPDPKTQFAFEFDPIGAIQGEGELTQLKARVDGEGLQNLYAEPSERTDAEKPSGRKPRTRKAKGKKTKAKKRTRAAG